MVVMTTIVLIRKAIAKVMVVRPSSIANQCVEGLSLVRCAQIDTFVTRDLL